jgi:hypothetical protein
MHYFFCYITMTTHKPVDHHIGHISSPRSHQELEPPASFHPPRRPLSTVFLPSEQPSCL